MSLDLVNDIFNNLKENKFVQNFINELSNYLEKNIKNSLDYANEEISIIDNILSENNVTTGNENSIRLKLNDVISNYAEQNFGNDAMYFVKDNKKTYWANNKEYCNNDVYTVLKVENNGIEELEINKQDMPKDIGINNVFRMKNGDYVVDIIATDELQNEIRNMAKEIIDKQNMNLEKYRKEGHLYMVTEEIGDNRFLRDLTDESKIEFEEVDIPKDLLDKSTEGVVLKYVDGKYEYYSDDGFERIENN